MKNKSFRKIILPVIAVLCLMSVVASIIVVAANDTYTFEYADESTLQPTYFQGETISVPKGQFVGDSTISAEAYVLLPNGNILRSNEITLSSVGRYQVTYTATNGSQVLQETKSFLVQQKKYTVSKNSASVQYVDGYQLKDTTVDGLKVTLPNGAVFNFNKVYNLNEFEKINTLVEGYILAATQGVYSAKIVTFRFTDIYDSDNYFDVVVDAAYEDGEGSGMSYYRVGAYNQTTSGWGGSTNEKDYTGTLENRLYIGDYGSWAGKLHWNTAENLHSLDNKVAFSIDYTAKEVYGQGVYSGKLVADMDSMDDFGMNLWNGFTTGECTLSVFASSYNDSAVTLLFTKLGDETSELSDNVYADTVAPNLDVDLMGYDENDLPQAVAGCAYPIFAATADDAYSSDVSLDVKVIYNKYGSNSCDMAIVNNTFTPNRLGVYTIVYTATDASGLVTEKEYSITCNHSSSNLMLSFSDSTALTAVAGQVITLPEISVSGAQGGYALKVTVQNTEESTVVTGNSYRPMKSGTYRIIYAVTDFAGQSATASLDLIVSSDANPVFIAEPTLPRYLVGGYENIIGLPVAIDFNTGNEVELEIWVKEGDNPQRCIDSNVFTPVISKTPYTLTITYVANSATGSSSVSYSLPCYSYVSSEGVDKKSMFVLGEGVTADYQQVGRTYYAAFSAASTAKSPSIEFLNPIYANGLSTEFAVWEGLENYGKLNIYLTDAVNGATIKISYFFKNGSVSVSVNDGTKYPTSDYLATNLDLGFDNLSSSVTWKAGEQQVTVDKDINGNFFDGFVSGKVYISYEMEELYGDSGFIIKTINGQIFNSSMSSGSLSGTAVIYNGSYQARMSLGAELQIHSAVAMNLTQPYKWATVTVQTPDGNVANAIDGTVLKNVSADYIYQVKLTEYGTYTITYTSSDCKSKQQLVTVIDEQAPTIKYTGKISSSYDLGATVTLEARAEDNITSSDNMTVTFVVNTPWGTTEYIGQQSASYQFRREGVYTIRAFTCDEYGNYAYVLTVVEVK